jgi:thiol-disulfide isomerase/thioredoxin
MRRTFLHAALDLVAGAAATAAVLFATDSFGADLRIYLVAAATLFFAVGVWRGGSAGPPLWLRPFLVALIPLVLAVQLTMRHWPPDTRGLSYAAFFPLVQWAAAAAGFALRRRPGRTPRRLVLALGGVLLASTLIATVAMPRYSRWLTTYEEQRPAPHLAFETLDGRPVDSADWQGKIVVLDFWASWCIPCVAELAELDRLHQRFRDRDDIVFFAIASQDEREKAERFAEQSSYGLPWAWDQGDQAYKALEASTIPSLYLIDRQGRIRLTHVGYTAAEGFLGHVGGRVDDLLGER